MNPKARRRALLGIGAALAVVLVVGGRVAVQAIEIGVAHKAKALCSSVFVSGRDPAAVLAELHSDDLAILQYIDASIDSARHSVTAGVLGVVARRAVYREGLGCTLVIDGLTPPTLPNPSETIAAPAGSVQSDSAIFIEGAKAGDLQDAVARAFPEPDSERRRRTLAVVVMHRGRIVAERYATGIGPDTPLAGWSMTKSVMNALAGILVKHGRLALDEPVPVPEWQQSGDARGSITLDHLLRMSSGLHFDDKMASLRSDVLRMLFLTGDAAAFAAKMNLRFVPGTRWQYSNGTTNILARVMRNVLNDETEYLTFPRRALFDRLRMSSAIMETDAAGTFVASSYMYATARDWARFGTLYLQDGVWNGERVLPEGWVTYTTSPAPADNTRRYGAHFWLQVPDEYGGADGRLPVPAFHAVGHEGQFVTIVPSREVVIVRLGRTRYPGAWDHPAFVRDVLAGLDQFDRSRPGG
jgi:CubicO group peptidase (beta-lactamase class C family)